VHPAALDQHSGGSKPYQREKSAARAAGTIPGGNVGAGPGPALALALGPALRRRVVAVDAEANRLRPGFDPKVDERGTLQNSNFQFSFGKLLGFGDITMA
jgi:hypothetical protein